MQNTNMSSKQIFDFSRTFNSTEFKPYINVYNEIRKYDYGLPIEASVMKNMNFLAHWHNEIEIVHVLDGSIVMGVNSEKRVLNKGDIGFSMSGDIHYYDSSNTRSSILIIVFQPELIQRISNQLLNTRFESPFITTDMAESGKIERSVLHDIYRYFNLIHTEMTDKAANFEIFVKGYITILAGILLRCIPQVDEADGIRRAIGDKRVAMVQDAINFIEHNYSNDISLDDIANYLGISTFYFSRIFSKLTGITFKSYLNKIRINKAESLILTTSKKIIDIAYECGFNSLRTFNRVYRSIKGSTPSDLR